EWWTAFLAAEEGRCAPQPAVPPVGPPPWVPAESTAIEAPAAEPPPSAPVLPKQRAEESPGLSPAYLALAGLGRTDARLALSAADCAVLE
ncbi:MarR family transcriptional regulator, partial [Streptomyces sp. DT225]